ncbi:hypothetical protein MNBD_GAMMA08-2038 [hydrothermal vent metagenome]|uniref:Uncharacterized protein n=1 Tax=hydrothermal vent metagenome TaxID=652676 RepID=A0A3B0X714_9ZZZZ
MKKLYFIFLVISLMIQSLHAENNANETAENHATKIAEQREIHFKNIDELVNLRAPELALSYIKREQSKYNKDEPAEWLYWEQKRISLLQYMQRWKLINARVSKQREKLNTFKIATADRNWFLTQQLRALIKLKKYDEALSKARLLLWNANDLVRANTYAAWRRIIIQIYLNQLQIKDAQIAMRRYQQDYGELQNEDGLSWLQLQAELFIQLNQNNEAILLLKQIEKPEAQALVLLAKINAQVISPTNALDDAQLVLASIEENDPRKNLFQYVALVSAIAADDVEQAILLLEILLSEKNQLLSDSIIRIGGTKINADTLWELYLKKGNLTANRKGLLKGDDVSWYALGSNLFLTDPLTAKSLFAVLSLKAKELQHRELAMKQLVKLMDINQQPLELVNHLFTQSKYISTMSAVVPEVRYRLIDFNLSHSNVKAAAVLMADLKQPPQDQPQFDWNLRRARVLILSGSFAQGANVLNEMLDNEDLEELQADKYLQVVFDLQAVEQHKLALGLFNKLQNLTEDVRLNREIMFWKAESYHELKLFEQAAFLFLKSARSPENVFDPWYHTATFRAAQSMFDAKLYEDAKQRYLHLLKITQNSARKAVIRQRLQAIQLTRQKIL